MTGGPSSEAAATDDSGFRGAGSGSSSSSMNPMMPTWPPVTVWSVAGLGRLAFPMLGSPKSASASPSAEPVAASSSSLLSSIVRRAFSAEEARFVFLPSALGRSLLADSARLVLLPLLPPPSLAGVWPAPGRGDAGRAALGAMTLQPATLMRNYINLATVGIPMTRQRARARARMALKESLTRFRCTCRNGDVQPFT